VDALWAVGPQGLQNARGTADLDDVASHMRLAPRRPHRVRTAAAGRSDVARG